MNRKYRLWLVEAFFASAVIAEGILAWNYWVHAETAGALVILTAWLREGAVLLFAEM